LSLEADLPNGFRERARTTGRVRFVVANNRDVRTSLEPLSYEVTLMVPRRFDGWGDAHPPSVLTHFQFLADLPPVNDGRQAFQVATASLMAVVRWLGAQAT